MFSLSGKIAYVTGGSGLIGRAIVEALSDAEAHVVSLDIKDTAEASGRYAYVEFDAADIDGMADRLASLEKIQGAADIWVNAAYPRTEGFGKNQLGDLQGSDWQKNVDLQMNATCMLSSLVAENMAGRGRGSIINLASIYGMRGPDLRVYDGLEMPLSPPVYAAIKGGLINYGRYLAAWYGQRGVRINTLCPGGIEDGQDLTFIEQYRARVPQGRMGRPEDIAGPVVFLASEAAAYITGATLPVDGGWTAV